MSFSGSVAGGSLNLVGTATDLTSLTVDGGDGKNTIDAAGVQVPLNLYGGAGAQADTLIGGSGSDTLFYSGVGSTYEGSNGGLSVLDYPANAGDVIAFGGGQLLVNDEPKPIGSLTDVEGFLASGSPAAVNGGTQFFLPVNEFPLTNLTITGVTVAVGSPAVTLSGGFTDLYPNVTAGTDIATIDWGDGTTSTGTITSSGGGNFTVSASHIYATDASWIISLTLVDPNGSAASQGYSFTGGLALEGSGNLDNYSSSRFSLRSTLASVPTRSARPTGHCLHSTGAARCGPSPTLAPSNKSLAPTSQSPSALMAVSTPFYPEAILASCRPAR